jgi:hypothetical protein
MRSRNRIACALALAVPALGAGCFHRYAAECWPPDTSCVGDDESARAAEELARSFSYCRFGDPWPVHIETPTGRSRFVIGFSRSAPWWTITGEPGRYLVQLASEPDTTFKTIPTIDAGVALPARAARPCFRLCFGPGCAPVVGEDWHHERHTATDAFDIHLMPSADGVRFVDLTWEPAPADAPATTEEVRCPLPGRTARR